MARPAHAVDPEGDRITRLKNFSKQLRSYAEEFGAEFMVMVCTPLGSGLDKLGGFIMEDVEEFYHVHVSPDDLLARLRAQALKTKIDN